MILNLIAGAAIFASGWGLASIYFSQPKPILVTVQAVEEAAEGAYDAYNMPTMSCKNPPCFLMRSYEAKGRIVNLAVEISK